jgi:anti-anti-sigma factor
MSTNKCLPEILELSITNPRAGFTDERSSVTVELPAEFDEQTVLINLNQVARIDSWGLALFIEIMQRITAHGGNLALFGIQGNVRRVFETTRLDQVFRIFSTREEALANRAGAGRQRYSLGAQEDSETAELDQNR